MLLLVTIGLVLIAAVTLVIGFVSNSLTPIYISIVCSAVAALVLYLFYRMNRRPARGEGRRPLVDSTPPVFSRGSPAPAPRRQSSKVVTGSGSTAPGDYDDDAYAADQPRFAEPPVASDPPTQRFRRVAPAAAPAPPATAPAPAPVAAPATAPAAEEEAAPPTRGRPEPLAVAEATPGAGPAGSTSMSSPPAPVAVPAGAAGAAAAGWSEPLPFPIEEYDDLRVVQIIPLLPELDDQELQAVKEYELGNRNRMAIVSRIDGLLAETGDEDEGVDEAEAPAPTGADDLPIADYDFLGVSELLPLLGELDADELEQVRDYEENGRGRATVVVRIDSLLAAMAEPAPAPEPEAAPEPEPEPEAAAGPSLPIANYDNLRVFQILAMLPDLDDAELEAVREYEQANRSRITILNQVDTQLSGASAPEAPEAPAAAPAAPPAPPEPEPEPEPAGDAAGLPIADYDDLGQGEILLLLDELEDDELADVRDYEDAHRSRVAILFRIDALVGPAEPEAADEADVATDTPGGDEAEVAAEDEAVPESAPEEAADEEEEQWGELPIADYDDLSQIEILPLLDQLYDDELDDVRDYEETHRARVAILFRIDALLAAEEEPEAEPEPDADDADDAGDAEVEAEPEEPEAAAAEATGVQGDADAGDALTAEDLPIADYDQLTVSEILPLLPELDDDELADIRDYEDANLGRVAIIARIDSMYEPSEEAEPPTEEPEAEAADEEPAEEAAAELEPEEAEPEPEVEDEPVAVAAPAEDEAFDADEAYDDEADEFEDEEEAAPAAAEDFPIADYDELRVAEILPLLSQLQPDELDVVARHEEQLANRSTILNRIQRLLDLGDKNPS